MAVDHITRPDQPVEGTAPFDARAFCEPGSTAIGRAAGNSEALFVLEADPAEFGADGGVLHLRRTGGAHLSNIKTVGVEITDVPVGEA